MLAGLGIRVNQHDRQLEERHAEQERERRVTQFRSDLLSALERIKNQAHAGGDAGPNTALMVARVHDGTLELPFDDNPQTQQFRASLSTTFGERIREAELEEFSSRRFSRAVELYGIAAAQSRHPWERAYATLLRARAAQQGDQHGEALRLYQAVLKGSPGVTDEYGVPLALYAAAPLVEAGNGAEVGPILSGLMRDPSRLGPQALYKVRVVAGLLQASSLVPEIDRLIREREQAEALQAAFPRLLPRLEADEPVWLPFGEPLWLISLARTGGEPPLLIAVSAMQLGSAGGTLQGVRIVQSNEGESLGDNFPSLRAIIPPQPIQEGGLRPAFLMLTLVLVMALTLFAGWLLWHEVRLNARLSELRSQFVASVSHELRTPLTSIRMFTESMRMDDEMDAAARNEYLDTVLRECERLSRLVDNVLHFARIEQGRAGYNLRPVSAMEVVERAVRAFSQPASEAGFRVEVQAPSGLPDVLADRDALEQAILNLLGNAMKYSGESREITLRVDRQGGSAAISVTDYGIGIAPQEQARIFERFYRAATPENRQIPGTGLGLTLVEHIVKGHGGGISIESRPRAGATFTIRLPFMSNANAAETAIPERV